MQDLDTDHAEYVVDYQVEDVIPRLLKHFGEPFADSSAIPTYHSRVTSESVTVALSGDGAGLWRISPVSSAHHGRSL